VPPGGSGGRPRDGTCHAVAPPGRRGLGVSPGARRLRGETEGPSGVTVQGAVLLTAGLPEHLGVALGRRLLGTSVSYWL
jgi:hypothetical protein